MNRRQGTFRSAAKVARAAHGLTAIYRQVPAARLSLGLAVLGTFVMALSDALLALAALPLLGSVVKSVQMPALFSWVQRSLGIELSLDGGEKTIVSLTVLLAGLLVRQMVNGVLQSLAYHSSLCVVLRLRERLMVGLLRSSFAYVDGIESGRIRQTIMTEIPLVGTFVRGAVGALASALTLLILAGLMLYVAPQLVLLSLLLTPAVLAWKFLYTKKLYRTAARRVELGHALANLLNEAILGLRQLKLGSREAEFGSHLHAISSDTEHARNTQFLLATWEPVLLQCSALVLILALLWTAPAVGLATPYEVLVFAFLLYRVMPSVTQFSTNVNILLVNEPSVASVLSAQRDSEAARETSPPGAVAIERIAEIEIDDVALSFPGKDLPALDGVSLSARRGDLVGIVGRSGSGKSTLVHLLLGMYRPSGGRIRLDGRDLSDIDLRALRRAIGIVSQDVHLFNTTIADVIAGGDRAMSAERIAAAARAADIADFIETLPRKYRTRVGERGMTLSGGQRQRLLLAQVLARKPSVIIFDEATSALDSVSEEHIFRTLEELRRDHICLVVTHRLDNLRDASRIHVLDGGRVADAGTFDELFNRPGLFQTLQSRAPERVTTA